MDTEEIKQTEEESVQEPAEKVKKKSVLRDTGNVVPMNID